MTSEFTLGPTIKFFKEHDFFHLDPTNVVLFEQRMLPAVTFEGKAILERKDKVAMAPGMAHTLHREGLPSWTQVRCGPGPGWGLICHMVQSQGSWWFVSSALRSSRRP